MTKLTKSNIPSKINLPRALRRMFPSVESVIDADKPIELSVNRKDCKEAKGMDPTNCAMARAARRELHADAAIIGISTSYIIKDNVAVRYKTPESVRREIISFDRHHDFAPGNYYLTTKAPTENLGHYHDNDRETGRSGGKNKTAKRKIHHSARVRILPRGSDRQ